MSTIKRLIGAVSVASHAVQHASSLAMICGVVYLVDCRLHSEGREAIDRCYFTALPLMGVGFAGRTGFQAGYQTFNPSLKDPRELTASADAESSKKPFGRGR